ncbi:hypothetical protein C8R45DRAFT_1078592, partial [Mycena sanguinolenta]
MSRSVGLRDVPVSDGYGSRLTGTAPVRQARKSLLWTDGYGTAASLLLSRPTTFPLPAILLLLRNWPIYCRDLEVVYKSPQVVTSSNGSDYPQISVSNLRENINHQQLSSQDLPANAGSCFEPQRHNTDSLCALPLHPALNHEPNYRPEATYQHNFQEVPSIHDVDRLFQLGFEDRSHRVFVAVMMDLISSLLAHFPRFLTVPSPSKRFYG